jgi:hypothetical protein
MNETLVLLDVSRSKKTEDRVRERLEKCQCVACGAESKNLRRGLCVRCYCQWLAARNRMNEREAVQFDANLIRQGWILARQESRRLRSRSVFERLMNK